MLPCACLDGPQTIFTTLGCRSLPVSLHRSSHAKPFHCLSLCLCLQPGFLALNMIDNTQHELATASTQGLQHCFSLPCLLTSAMRFVEKRRNSYFSFSISFFFSPVREAGLGQLHCSAVLSNPGYQGRRHRGNISLQHQLGTAQPLVWWDMRALPYQVKAMGYFK